LGKIIDEENAESKIEKNKTKQRRRKKNISFPYQEE